MKIALFPHHCPIIFGAALKININTLLTQSAGWTETLIRFLIKLLFLGCADIIIPFGVKTIYYEVKDFLFKRGNDPL